MLKYKKLTAYLLSMTLVCTSFVNFNLVTAQAADSVKASATPVVGTTDADIAMTLAQALVGSDITVTSAKLFGEKSSFGTLQNGEDIIGFSDGIILSNGNIFDTSPDPLDTTKWTDLVFGYGATNFLSSDLGNVYSQKDTNTALADALTGFWEATDVQGNSYNDPTMLEFTFVPKSDTISFQYVMASEEYPQYINSFQDKFLLNVNGTNYAVVPDTNGATTVTIGNINHERNTAYYRGVTSGSSNSVSTENRISEDNFSFNGETTVLSVDATVTPNQTATVRMAVADKNDGILDTAVFIKAKSVSDKQVLYGSLNISAIDNNNNTITISRTGGKAGYVSADAIFYSSDNTTLQTINVPFADGETQKVITYPASSYSVQLANPIGGVKLASTDKIVLGNPYSTADLSQIVAAISGSALIVNADTTITAASGCSITLKQGNSLIATTQTDANGAYQFTNIPGGFYNILVESPSKSGFGFVKVDQSAVVADTIYLYGQVYINLNSGVPDILIQGLPVPSVDGTFSVNVSALTSMDSSTQGEVDNGAYKLNGNVALVLDFTLLKDGIAQTTLASPIMVTFDIPAAFLGKDNYYIYQIHDNGNGVLSTETLYDCDNDPTTITVKISSFSAFAMIYTGSAVATPTVAPTAAPTVAPTAAPTVAPTAAPTTTPTVVPSTHNNHTSTSIPVPTATPSPSPSASATPVPVSEEVYAAMADINLSVSNSTIYANGTCNNSTQLSVDLPSIISAAVTKGKATCDVKYYSSKDSVAVISDSGLIEAVSKGTATIYANVLIGTKSMMLQTTIKVKDASVSFTDFQSKMSVGDKYTFTIQCNGYDPKDIVWKTTKKKIVVVSGNNGKTSAIVSAKSKGTDYVQIRVSNKDGKIVKYNIKVNVK
ncbi:MAG: choice-of-anchor L domain-containing protein [Herbinix sp.]|nr:choice-of-anchor L domain-containing protein [Herbinix sp.]